MIPEYSKILWALQAKGGFGPMLLNGVPMLGPDRDNLYALARLYNADLIRVQVEISTVKE